MGQMWPKSQNKMHVWAVFGRSLAEFRQSRNLESMLFVQEKKTQMRVIFEPNIVWTAVNQVMLLLNRGYLIPAELTLF